MKRSFLGLVLRLAAAALLAIIICGAAATPSDTATTTAPTAFAVTAITQQATTSTTRTHPGVTGVNGNPWGYNYSCCHLIRHPAGSICTYFSCIKSFWRQTRGYVEQCRDGMISHSGGRRGSCSWHGGNQRPLYQP